MPVTAPHPPSLYSTALKPANGWRFGGLILLLMGTVPPASAHDWWLSSVSGRTVLQQGHRPMATESDSGPRHHSGPAIIDYPAGQVREALCLRSGQAAKTLAVNIPSPWHTDETCDALLIRISSGYWSKTAWETVNRPRTGLTGVLHSWQSLESVKMLSRWHPSLQKAQGKDLELTPQHNPLPLAPGDKLTLRVTLDGVPQADAAVSYDGSVRGHTDADGLIRIRLRHPGPQWLTAHLETPLHDGQADRRVLSATLQFELAQ